MRWAMKYVIVLGDGMADLPIKELDDRTPMEAAVMHYTDSISHRSMQGIVDSIPKGMEPGSDVANLSILGYDPGRYYTGRSGIEAVGMGIDLKETDLALRTNLATIKYAGSYMDSVMIDHGSDDITSEEAYILLDAVTNEFGSPDVCFYKGVSYRHLLVLSDSKNTFKLTPPHDILGRKVTGYLPAGENSNMLFDMMEKSYDFLSRHEINLRRIKSGLNPANTIWFWGAGTKLSLPDFKDMNGLSGGVISAVDLVNGIGRAAGMKVIKVEGANGTINTNYSGKVKACLDELRDGLDFVYIHIEAPDECGHKGDYAGKIKAIELIDRNIIGPILGSGMGPVRVMFLPDHPTPVCLRTHTDISVPFLIYDSNKIYDGTSGFSEKTASSTGLHMSDGRKLFDLFTG
jgi:2,3-bisphosphoglycerate-independent phosphoglycerate mutase